MPERDLEHGSPVGRSPGNERELFQLMAQGILSRAPRKEDLVQDVLLACLVKPERCRGSYWFVDLCRRKARQAHLRDLNRRAREVWAALPEAQPSTVERVVEHESSAELHQAIQRLERSYEVVIRMRFFEGLPPRRIAVDLGLPVSTIRTRLHRGLRRLMRELEPHQ